MEYKIGEFSLVSRIPVKTLRYYHEVGILEPAHVNPHNGYRMYEATQLETARTIRLLRSLEFSIDAIRQTLADLAAGRDIEEIVHARQEAVRERLAELLALEKRLELLRAEAPRAGAMRERRLEPVLVATQRFTGRYMDVGFRFGELMRHAGDLMSGVPEALYWQDEYREDDADISVSVPVSRPLDAPGVEMLLLPACDALTTVYRGPYEGISAGYERVLGELEERSLVMVLPIRERYIKGPGDSESQGPDDYLTEIVVPVTAAPRSPGPSD